jgi:hypothetical protein
MADNYLEYSQAEAYFPISNAASHANGRSQGFYLDFDNLALRH